jgi:hypothetical protein
VAIPLRENVPIFFFELPAANPWNSAGKFAPTQALEVPLKNDFKLLKFLILRVILRLTKLYHKRAFLEPSKSAESSE